ncbi:MAG: WYL domain-containing protein, partial [Candidatus Hadarchaeum sp.]
IVAALNKLATAFPDPLTDYISRTAQAVQKRPVNPTFVAVLETISLCWAEKHKVHLWYRSPRSGALRQHDFSPYLIEPSSAGGLYVIGYDDWARGIRTFKLERLERAERSEETYDIPKEFDPSGYLADAWGIMGGETPTWIVLRFSPVVSTYVRERIWHPLQILQTLDDGSVLLRLRIADPREIRPWIRSWGAEVEVLEPETLRRELAEEASRTAALYADKS